MPVPYVTQGTIQVEVTSTKTLATITPVADYHAKHADREYTVFFVEPEPKPEPKPESPGQSGAPAPESFLYNVSQNLNVPEKLESIISHVALTSVRVMITIKDKPTSGNATITGIKFPAKA